MFCTKSLMIDDHPAYPEFDMGNCVCRDILMGSTPRTDICMSLTQSHISILVILAITLVCGAPALGHTDEDSVVDPAGIEFFENRFFVLSTAQNGGLVPPARFLVSVLPECFRAASALIDRAF